MDLDTRVNRMGERLAVVENQTRSLEQSVPRIARLEALVSAVTAKLDGLVDSFAESREATQRIQDGMDQMQAQTSDLSHRIGRLFWTGAGAMLVIGSLATGITLLINIDNWWTRQINPEQQQEAIVNAR